MGNARKLEIATANDRDIVFTRSFDAPRALVFDAWTKPELVRRWLLGPPGWTMPVCEIDLRPGGAWRYVYRKSGEAEMTLSGHFREVSPPERVVFTETWGPEWPETLNTMALREAGGLTTVTLSVLYASAQARDAALKSGMKEGMEATFARFDDLLARMA